MHSKTLSAAAALFASVALIAGAVAPASAATNDPAKKQEASSQDQGTTAKTDKKRYCLQDTFTGSRIAKRKCLTRAEWIQQTGQDPVQAQ